MRNNQPVTQQAFELPDDVTLMSTTDPQGRIDYANDAFISASGFTAEDLQGQPHNVVRHPDMPPQAFADMWRTLQQGEPWTALVKNRRKNGDHYWVRANAMPVVRDGALSGYMSVRTKPTADEVASAAALYADVLAGRARGLAFHKGLVIRLGWRGWWSRRMQTLSVRHRVQAALLGAQALTMVGTAALDVSLASMAGFGLLSGCALALAGWWLDHQIVRPLMAIREHALRVASGEHRHALQLDRVDEIGTIARAIGQMGLTFRWVVDDVSAQLNNLEIATREIAQGNHDLAARTEKAAASVDTTASTMEEITATVDNNANTATEARQLSADASNVAALGGEAVSNIVTTMNEITDSSRRINDIIGVIDSIAFQTNILALNAAVEAARAGEQGRGFAVVAGEVRALAQRSASAAREIKALISGSVDKVEAGSKLVDDAGKTMNDLVRQVQQVSSLLSDISMATSEQCSGIAQVAHAIQQLDEVTQQNAALVEQSAVASSHINAQTRRLVSAVRIFG
ncbi:MAG: methyl-accepting chemotaxis protein [Aquabacterium sp.]